MICETQTQLNMYIFYHAVAISVGVMVLSIRLY